MNWKFWQKEKPGENSSGAKEAKLEKPKELPQRVGMHLVTKLKEDPDWVWSLKAALRPKSGEKHTFDIRIFDPHQAAQKGLTIMDYNSLDDHPDLFLFVGSFNKNSGLVNIDKALKDVA
jgi:hypothetical protein